jgi:hypothetical protein
MPPSVAESSLADRIEGHIRDLLRHALTLQTCANLKRKGRHPVSSYAYAYQQSLGALAAATHELETYYQATFKETPEGAPSQGGSGA